MTEPERHITFLGALNIEPGQPVTLAVDPNATPEQIAAAIQAANAEREWEIAEESRRLRELFQLPDLSKGGLS
jgi:hypothetical protein